MSDRVWFRKADKWDIDSLAPKLREEDMAELAASGIPATAALREGITTPGAEAYTAVYGPTAEPSAVFGAVPVSAAGNTAVVWLLGTRRVDSCKFEYLHFGQRFLAYLRGRYHLLFNRVDERSVKSVRFLRLLGFRFDPTRDLVGRDTTFLYFEMEGENV